MSSENKNKREAADFSSNDFKVPQSSIVPIPDSFGKPLNPPAVGTSFMNMSQEMRFMNSQT